MSIQLKFPQVRLMVYDALIERRIGCVQAIVSCAHNLGLIATDRLRDLKLPIDAAGCGSLFAAEQVLYQCLADKGGADKSLAEQLWSDVKRSVELYKEQTQLVHDRKAGDVTPAVECSHMAPIVMDLLVQKLQPYV
jgi:hypothetical protein